jgi:hypothetical protein
LNSNGAVIKLFCFLWHFALFFGACSTNRAAAMLILDHWIIGSAGSPEFLTCKDLPDINQGKGNSKKAEYY